MLDGKEVRRNERGVAKWFRRWGSSQGRCYGQAQGHGSCGRTNLNPRWLGFKSLLCCFLA